MIKKIFNTVMVFLDFGVFLLWMPAKVYACAVCYGAVDSPLTKGLNMAILTLLIILVGVLGSVAAFLLYVRKRSKENESLAIH